MSFNWRRIFPTFKKGDKEGSETEQLMEIIKGAADTSRMDPEEKKMLESVVSLRDRIVREVMVPRVDIFALPAKTPLREAAKELEENGYSRVPIYTNGIDEIIGILMYKDLLAKYREAEKAGNPAILDAPIETLIKSVLFTPETKKISQLLQEFRKKQQHLAVVVDEYGGTEGIVTFEDILEEIVGNIIDEYDEEEPLYQPLPSGGWLVDARMSILDIEEELGIKIPDQGDYDTLGGYIFHHTATIPPPGFAIEQDDFRIEVVSSSERCVEKVRLLPLKSAA